MIFTEVSSLVCSFTAFEVSDSKPYSDDKPLHDQLVFSLLSINDLRKLMNKYLVVAMKNGLVVRSAVSLRNFLAVLGQK